MISPISNSYDPYYNSIPSGTGSERTANFPGRDDSSINGRQLPGDRNASGKNRGVQDPQEECQTCKNRKYKDGSNEMVSFKSAQHVSPERAASAVRAHEQEHVSNAYKKAAKENGKVVSAAVSIRTEICPECGRSYVAGGTTRTQIKYYNEENPYQQDLKNADKIKYAGMNLDYAV
jgi:hypothetical protein